jgi:phosphopantetheinyl transferase (holo-ACP synthase)
MLPLIVAPTVPGPEDPAWSAWLTAGERAYAAGRRRAAEHLAARRLAKLAALRALAWPSEPPWADLVVERPGGGRPVLRLGGDLAVWCAGRGLAAPGVSLSHAAGYAAALAWPVAGGPPEVPS